MDDIRKQNILNHIDKIEQYARQPGNEWLLEELQQRFFVKGRLDDIYEYCIENIITEQAKGFYQDFPLKPIVPQLIKDFVKMEHFRRKNNFDEFSMALYQQIEGISNAICRNDRFEEVVQRLIGHPAYVGSVKLPDGRWTPPTVENRIGTYQIAQLLWGNENAVEKSKGAAQGQYAIDKARLVLYFICYGAKLQAAGYDTFIAHKNTLDDIYQIRNRNHRGSIATEWQKTIYERIDKNKGLYYVKFVQLLCFFVESTSTGLSTFDKLHVYAMEQSPIAVKQSPKVVDKIDLSKMPGNTNRFKH